MRLNAFCIGHTIDLDRLKISLAHRHDSMTTDAIDGGLYQINEKLDQHIFYFNQGTIITWNLSRSTADQLVKKCLKFTDEKATQVEHDDFSFLYGTKTQIQPQGYFNVDIITLEHNDLQLKLAISIALSQSVKLQFFSTLIEETFDQHAHLIEKMRKSGRIFMGSRRLQKIVANLFTLKNRLNHNSEVLTTPQYFWRQSNFEPEYAHIHQFLEIETRVSALNQKLDVLHGMFDMFKSQIEHRHFFTLEVVIVILIFVEILESLPKLF